MSRVHWRQIELKDALYMGFRYGFIAIYGADNGFRAYVLNRQEVEQWCEDQFGESEGPPMVVNCQPGENGRWAISHNYVFFAEDNDAFAFKLRFG